MKVTGKKFKYLVKYAPDTKVKIYSRELDYCYVQETKTFTSSLKAHKDKFIMTAKRAQELIRGEVGRRYLLDRLRINLVDEKLV